MTTSTAAVDAMIHGRRADSTRRRQRVLAALDNAITDGAEKITKAHLDAVLLDGAAIAQYAPPRRRKG